MSSESTLRQAVTAFLIIYDGMRGDRPEAPEFTMLRRALSAQESAVDGAKLTDEQIDKTVSELYEAGLLGSPYPKSEWRSAARAFLALAAPVDGAKVGETEVAAPGSHLVSALDAARYRWFRNNFAGWLLHERFGYTSSQTEHWSNEQNRAKLDAAVDAARAGSAGGEG